MGGPLLPPSGPPTAPIPVTPPPMQPVGFRPRFGHFGAYLIGRFLAFLIDVFGIGFVIASFVYDGVTGGNPLNLGAAAVAAKNEGGFLALAAIGLGGALLFIYLCEAIFGSTLGKLLFGLSISNGRGGWAGFGRALVRGILRPIDALLIGPLLALVTPRHQRLGDLLGGTVVSRSPLGPFASLIGIVGLGAIAFAQYSYGGGLTTALSVSALGARFGPTVIQQVGAPLGLLIPNGAPASATPAAPVIDVTQAPIATPTEIPTEAPTEAPTPVAS